MKSLIKGKYKLFKLINYLFYIVIFLIGFFFGAFGKNILSFIDIFTIDNAYAISENYFNAITSTGTKGVTTYSASGNSILINTTSYGTENTVYLNDVSNVFQYLQSYSTSNDYKITNPGGKYKIVYTFSSNDYIKNGGWSFRLCTNKREINKNYADLNDNIITFEITLTDDEYIKNVQFYSYNIQFQNLKIDVSIYDVTNGYEYVYSNPINVYGGETQEQFESGYNGYTPIWTYDNVTLTQEYMTNEHIYEYLEFITQYLYDNYANEYDFVVSYRKINETFTTLNGGSGIYISYYKKGELSYVPIYSSISSYDEEYSYLTNEECMEKYDNETYCSTQTYISDYGWDFIEIFDENGNRVISHNQIYDLLNSYGPGILTQESRFEEYKKNFPEYADGQKYGEKYFPIRKYKYDENNVPTSSIIIGNSPGYMPYGYVKNDLKKATANGMMFYHSTLPLKYMNTEVAWAIGTKLYYSGDIIPTYTTETSSGGNTDFETDFTLDTSWLKENYNYICTSTPNVIIGRDSMEINSTNIYFPYDIVQNDKYSFYFEDYNYMLQDTNEIKYTEKNPIYYSRLEVSKDENVGKEQMGFSKFSYTFADNSVLLIKRTNDMCEYINGTTVCTDSSSGRPHGGASGTIGDNKDYELGKNYGHEGQYCFYVDKRLYISYLETIYHNYDDKYNSDFTGTIQTPQGIFDVNYQDPDAHKVSEDSIFYQANRFIEMMKPTFGFIGNLFMYFFVSIPVIVRYFIYALLLIILIFWVINSAGGDK